MIGLINNDMGFSTTMTADGFEGWPLRVLLLILLPTLSLFPGYAPAQEARCAAVRNLSISGPIAERMIFAELSVSGNLPEKLYKLLQRCLEP